MFADEDDVGAGIDEREEGDESAEDEPFSLGPLEPGLQAPPAIKRAPANPIKLQYNRKYRTPTLRPDR